MWGLGNERTTWDRGIWKRHSMAQSGRASVLLGRAMGGWDGGWGKTGLPVTASTSKCAEWVNGTHFCSWASWERMRKGTEKGASGLQSCL